MPSVWMRSSRAREAAAVRDVVAVIGAGTMGHGIAQVAAAAGYTTRLYDIEQTMLIQAEAAIKTWLDKAVAKGTMEPAARDATLANLSFTKDLKEAVEGAGLVVEAVPEDLKLKKRVFSDLDGLADGEAVLASNTSSLPIATIARATRRPGRVLGMHFFNPVPLMALVEVVQHDDARQEAVDVAVEVARRMGKEPIVVQDTPGFATSRLGLALGLEAIRMLEEGVASAADIDKAMELGYRHPMGPLRLTDLVGLDVRLAIAEHLAQELGERFEPPALLRSKVKAGDLGRKTGRGFHAYKD
jgi:3-hydroxybutyryl-CoA dehydrogenase